MSELYDLCLDLTVVYKYTTTKTDREALKPMFDKMVNKINESKKGFIIDPNYLNRLDKEFKI